MGALPALFYLILALAALAMAGGLLVWVIRYAGSKDGSSSGERLNPTTAGTSAPEGEQELLRVSRTQKGKLVVVVQGRRYRHLREIADPQVGRETIEALKAVLAFAEGWLPTSPQAPSQPASGKSTVDEEAFLEQLSRSDLFSAGVTPASSRVGPLMPVEAINDLVQERLRKRPDLAGWHIFLTTERDGTLRFYVGPQSFESVDDIPEPEVQALIRDAIREWESSPLGTVGA
jgi:hypothetical protein